VSKYQPNDIAIAVVVRFAFPGHDLAAAFHHNVVVFGGEALGAVAVSIGELREQRLDQLGADGGLAAIGPRPCGRAGDDPAKILRHGVRERLAIAFRQLGKNVLHEHFVGSGLGDGVA
jgi:hypothetical protein